MWNVTSLVEKEPELVFGIEHFWLQLDSHQSIALWLRAYTLWFTPVDERVVTCNQVPRDVGDIESKWDMFHAPSMDQSCGCKLVPVMVAIPKLVVALRW